MRIDDDTPEPHSLPCTYPANPPMNLLHDELLWPCNLFAFEGIDGSGKSSVMRAVAAAVAERYQKVIPLKLAGSELVRHALERAKWLNVDPMCFNLLNWVSIFHQVSGLRDLYNSANLIFFDRYTLTVRLRGRMEGLASDYMDILERMVPHPAAIFLIDCDPDICLERIRAARRSITYFESGARHVPDAHALMVERGDWERTSDTGRDQQLKQTLCRLRKEYLRLAQTYPNLQVIDNSGELDAAVLAVLDNMPEILTVGRQRTPR
jgi:thymidylate kinase